MVGSVGTGAWGCEHGACGWEHGDGTMNGQYFLVVFYQEKYYFDQIKWQFLFWYEIFVIKRQNKFLDLVLVPLVLFSCPIILSSLPLGGLTLSGYHQLGISYSQR